MSVRDSIQKFLPKFKLRLTDKLILGFALVLLPMLGSGIWVLLQTEAIEAQAAAVSGQAIPALRQAQRCASATQDVVLPMEKFTESLDPRYSTEVYDALESLDRELASMTALSTRKKRAAKVSDSDQPLHEYLRGERNLTALLAAWGGEATTTENLSTGLDVDEGRARRIVDEFETAFARMDLAVGELASYRSETVETERTVKDYLAQAHDEQVHYLLDPEEDNEQVLARLEMMGEINSQLDRASMLATTAYEKRNLRYLEVAAKAAEKAHEQMQELLEITPEKRTGSEGYSVGMARKDLLSNAAAQVGLYKDALDYFILGWREMDEARENCLAALASLNDFFSAWREEAVAAAGSSASTVSETVTGISTRIMFGLPLVFIGGIVLGRVLGYFLARPVRKVTHRLNDIARGDLTTRLRSQASDEVGETSRTFNGFVEHLQGIVRNMSQDTQRLFTTSENFRENFDTMSDIAGKMSDSASEVAAAVEEMSASINEVNQHCTTETEKAALARERTGAVRERMENLEASAQEIDTIVQLIEDITQQSHLLGINAAIEAAHAGEKGESFGVVAAEVKKLSSQSANATRNIAAQVERIQADTTEVRAAVDEISRVVVEFAELATLIAESIRHQTSTTEEIARLMCNVSSGSHELHSRVRLVATGDESLAGNLSATAAEGEENSQGSFVVNGSRTSLAQVDAQSSNGHARNASVRDISRMATQLQDIVSQFRV